MTIDAFEISHEQVAHIFQAQEGHFYDLKRKEIKPAKLTNTLSAFANTDGGDVYVGVGEHEDENKIKTRFWEGFKDVEEANSHIQTLQEFFPFQQYLSIAFLRSELQNGLILHI